MVSSRRRASQSLGNRFNKVTADIEAIQKKTDSSLGAGEVQEENLATNSVGSDALQPNSVGSEALDRGAVGTENLGIITEIKSGDNTKFSLPGHVILDGASYPKPSAGAITQLALDENGQIVFGGGSEALAVGSVIDWAGGTLPANWLACDGSAISRATYNTLFQAIGTTYGAGNGTTTFNLPNKPAGYAAGRIGYASLAANATTTSTTAVALGAGLSITLNVVAGRQYRVQFDTPAAYSSIANEQLRYDIRAAGTVIKSHFENVGTLGTEVSVFAPYTAASTGSVTFDVQWLRTWGSGTLTTLTGAGQLTELLVYDEAESSAKFTHMIKYQQGISMGGGGGGGGASVTVSDFAPVSATAGDLWFYSVDGTLFTYYNDGDSAQWIEVGDVVASAEPNSVPAGSIVAWTSATIPNNWLLCDGSAVSRSTYASLFNAIGTTYGVGNGTTTFNLPDLSGRVIVGKKTPTSVGTATMTIAAPGVVTLTGHGLGDGFKVYFTTTGALPTGVTASTEYFVVNSTVNTFQLATTLGGAAITTTGSQSGTHTLWSSDFDLAETGGNKAHAHTANNMVAAVYVGYTKFRAALANWTATNSGGLTAPGANSTSGANGVSIEGATDPSSNLQPYITLNYIIKVSAAETPGDSQLAIRVGALEVADTRTARRLIPTSVSVGAGSASVDSDRRIQFTNVPSLSLNGIFTSENLNYLVLIYATAQATGDQGWYMRYRVGGVDDATTYGSSYNEWLNGVPQSAVTSSTEIRIGRSSTGYGGTIISFTAGGPALAGGRSRVHSQYSDGSYMGIGGGAYGSNKAHDGFTIFNSGGASYGLTGTMEVYAL